MLASGGAVSSSRSRTTRLTSVPCRQNRAKLTPSAVELAPRGRQRPRAIRRVIISSGNMRDSEEGVGRGEGGGPRLRFATHHPAFLLPNHSPFVTADIRIAR